VRARFNDAASSPALLTRRLGRGTALLVTTSADDKWTDWPRSEAGRVTYVPFLHRVVEEMAAAQSPELNLEAGSPLAWQLDTSAYERTALLRPPVGPGGGAGAPVALQAGPREEQPGLWLAGGPLDTAGLWALELKRIEGGTETVYVAVNMPAAERRLARVPAGAFAAAALSPDTLRVVRGDDARLAGLEGGRRVMWPAVAAVLLAVLLVESVMAYVFGNPRKVREEDERE